MSIPIEDVVEVLRAGGYVTDTKALQNVAKALIAVEKESKEASKATGPKSSSRLVALIRGDKALAQAVAGGCFVVSVPDSDTEEGATYAADSLVSRLRKAVAEHNDTTPKRGRKNKRIETWRQAFTYLQPKTITGSGSAMSSRAKGNPCEVVVLTSETVNL